MLVAMDSCFGLIGPHQHGIANTQAQAHITSPILDNSDKPFLSQEKKQMINYQQCSKILTLIFTPLSVLESTLIYVLLSILKNRDANISSHNKVLSY